MSIELYGCSFVSAELIKQKFFQAKRTGKRELKWLIPSFQDLHPDYAQPFHVLFCYLLQLPLFNRKDIFKIDTNNEIRFYTKEEITGTQIWKDLMPPASIGKMNSDRERNSIREFSNAEQFPSFHPKYLLVLPITKRQSGLNRLS